MIRIGSCVLLLLLMSGVLLAASCGGAGDDRDKARSVDGGWAAFDAAHVDLSSGDDALLAYVGSWYGQTDDGHSISFSVDDLGYASGLSTIVSVKFQQGICAMTFFDLSAKPILGGKARFELQQAGFSFFVPLEIAFQSSTTGRGLEFGFAGPFKMRCMGPPDEEGDREVVAPVGFSIQRWIPPSSSLTTKTGK